MLKLRGHHLLCIQGFQGQGYSRDFVENMASIIQELEENLGQPVELVASCDSICARCPWNRDGTCSIKGPNSEERLGLRDRRVLRAIGAREGAILTFREVQSRITGLLEEFGLESFCEGCRWLALCRSAEYRRVAREVRLVMKPVELNIKTKQRNEAVDITRSVAQAIMESGVTEGFCIVFVPHTTAAVTINENADPDVREDLLDFLSRVVPVTWPQNHVEGNSDAHVKSSLVGTSVTVIISSGRPLLGTWQGIYFLEFDGPRERRVMVKIIGS